MLFYVVALFLLQVAQLLIFVILPIQLRKLSLGQALYLDVSVGVSAGVALKTSDTDDSMDWYRRFNRLERYTLQLGNSINGNIINLTEIAEKMSQIN